MEKQLPKGWKWVKLGEVCEIISGKNQAKVINPNGKYPIYGSSGIFGYADEYLCKEETTVVGRKGTINSPMFVKTKFWNVDTAFGLSPNESYDNKLLYYFCKSFNFHKLDKSTTIPSLAKRDLLTIDIPLPTLPTQHAIVSKIEELFSELDKGIENLRTAQQQLKTYRQAVLKWAFEGRLTNEDERDGELPEGWKWKTLKEITSTLGDGLHGTPEYTENGDYHFINGNNLSDGRIIFKDSTKRVSYQEYQKHKKNLDDTTILVSINGTLGNTAFYNGEKVILGKSACYFNLKPETNKQYIRYIITSQRFFNYAKKMATGSTIPNVSLKAMREFKVPLPPIEEQNKIIKEIESRLSVADKMEENIKQSLEQAEALRQSILIKGFEGRLT